MTIKVGGGRFGDSLASGDQVHVASDPGPSSADAELGSK
jgi:hypothetical protein